MIHGDVRQPPMAVVVQTLSSFLAGFCFAYLHVLPERLHVVRYQVVVADLDTFGKAGSPVRRSDMKISV